MFLYEKVAFLGILMGKNVQANKSTFYGVISSNIDPVGSIPNKNFKKHYSDFMIYHHKNQIVLGLES